jgi:hypothetical protein
MHLTPRQREEYFEDVEMLVDGVVEDIRGRHVPDQPAAVAQTTDAANLSRWTREPIVGLQMVIDCLESLRRRSEFVALPKGDPVLTPEEIAQAKDYNPLDSAPAYWRPAVEGLKKFLAEKLFPGQIVTITLRGVADHHGSTPQSNPCFLICKISAVCDEGTAELSGDDPESRGILAVAEEWLETYPIEGSPPPWDRDGQHAKAERDLVTLLSMPKASDMQRLLQRIDERVNAMYGGTIAALVDSPADPGGSITIRELLQHFAGFGKPEEET